MIIESVFGLAARRTKALRSANWLGCAKCGTPLFGGAENSPHLIFVRVGTLDYPSAFGPSANIWTKSAPTWACLDPSLPIVEGQPRPDS